jgi:hypothetical protein
VLPAPLVLSANGGEPVNLAVEITRTVPASGNLCVCQQQFWLGPDRAGTTITLGADTTVVHLMHNGGAAEDRAVPADPHPPPPAPR